MSLCWFMHYWSVMWVWVQCLTLKKQNLWWCCWPCFCWSRRISCLTWSARDSVIRGSDCLISANNSSGFVLHCGKMQIYIYVYIYIFYTFSNFRSLDGDNLKSDNRRKITCKIIIIISVNLKRLEMEYSARGSKFIHVFTQICARICWFKYEVREL